MDVYMYIYMSSVTIYGGVKTIRHKKYAKARFQ
jgi:hypothetical protein